MERHSHKQKIKIIIKFKKKDRMKKKKKEKKAKKRGKKAEISFVDLHKVIFRKKARPQVLAHQRALSS